jgi:lysosomal Pro-X carboxypeptidase
LTPNYDWAMNTFGGRHNYSMEYRQYSNIIFSNGDLDPWYAGGVTKYVGPNVPVYIIEGGAHHLDLRLPDD